ncbi:uncharacterized protein DS421_2g51250 [Arachis hypogaea]|nr:uncharacterized protein DS421_2g51250 [Arachis hypogaea]
MPASWIIKHQIVLYINKYSCIKVCDYFPCHCRLGQLLLLRSQDCLSSYFSFLLPP